MAGLISSRKPEGQKRIADQRLSEPRTLMVVGANDSDREFLNYLAHLGYIVEYGIGEEGLHEQILRDIPNVLLLDMDSLGDRVLDIITALKDNPMTYTRPITFVIGEQSLDGEISALQAGAEDYLHKPIASQILAARIDTILRRNTRLQISNPLTGLPGSLYIEEQITKRLRERLPLGVCYADLDNFKAFNDTYGYARGDNVIRIMATILNESVAMFARKGDFVGHIGGDDFVVIINYDYVDEVCGYITNSFDTLIPFQYDDRDMVRGYIEAENRQRELVRVPIMTVSIGVVTNQHRRFTSFLKISELSAEMKEYAKSISKDESVLKSSYRVDQRGPD